jgi:hypothetical protein
MKKLTLTLILVFLTAACAKDSDDSSNGQQIAAVPPPQYEQPPTQVPPNNGGHQPRRPRRGQGQGGRYGYQYWGNNCNTGYQQFQTLDQYCAALCNDIKNNHCATQDRYVAFRQFCGQRSWR